MKALALPILLAVSTGTSGISWANRVDDSAHSKQLEPFEHNYRQASYFAKSSDLLNPKTAKRLTQGQVLGVTRLGGLRNGIANDRRPLGVAQE